jgi:sugar phosphate isomerase/epimerase
MKPVRLGAPLYSTWQSGEEWASAIRAKNYSAAYCPLKNDANDATVNEFAAAAANHDIVIAEVGAWNSNPISTDEAERQRSIAFNQAQLALADRIGARCCVNIAGSRSPSWHGPHPDNLSDDTFALIVESVRKIIDDVQPTRTFYALECMQWVFPDSIESYERLIAAIDRPAFAVHLDPVNLVNCPSRYYDTTTLIRESFRRLGSRLRCCHAKDVTMSLRAIVHIDEVRPGLGTLDYATYLTELARMAPDAPLMLEHLPSEAEYDLAAAHIRAIAATAGVTIQ